MQQATSENIKELLVKIKGYLPRDKADQVEEAYNFASTAHKGQKRVSGGPYVEHPLSAASFLADLHLDATTLSAALLHDVVEDCGITQDDLKTKFGPDVAKLVDGVTKLTRMELTDWTAEGQGQAQAQDTEDRLKAETLRKMLVAMAEDIRVVLIKLADRLHNMQTLNALRPERQRAIAQETLDIYAPLANRLGIWEIKWRLEDLAFKCLDPEKYEQISQLVAVKREEREAYVADVENVLKTELEKVGLKSAQVSGRPKHIYSIYQKSLKYAGMGKHITDIYDLYALRVLVKTKEECYHALGVVHNMWRPMPGQFDDYIASPKENLYQSLHTTVMCKNATPLEVQIRTVEMHQLSEYGVAAHWRYKGGSGGDLKFDEKMTWLRQLLEWQPDVSGTEEFLESVKMDLFKDQVFVYTPKGKIIELPAGATPIDFAYRIHTELGHRCIGAKINGRLMSLDYQLQNGDTIEILTTKVARGPSLDWLNPNLGYIRTASARGAVRQWFRRQRRGDTIQMGRELLRKEAKRLNMKVDEEELASIFKQPNAEEFLIALGSGEITINQVLNRLSEKETKAQQEVKLDKVKAVNPGSGITVLGVGDLLTRLARCCGPIPGDHIVGFITRSRGVTVHKRECPSIQNEDEKERIVEVEWGQEKQLYPVRLEIQARNRVGLLRDITTRVSEEGVNIAAATSEDHTDGTAIISLTLHTTGMDQLSRLFAKLDSIRGVVSASRIVSSAAAGGRS